MLNGWISDEVPQLLPKDVFSDQPRRSVFLRKIIPIILIYFHNAIGTVYPIDTSLNHMRTPIISLSVIGRSAKRRTTKLAPDQTPEDGLV